MESHYTIAIVTGASSGIGRAVAERLARQGLRVVLVARRKEKLAALAKRLGAFAPCYALPCDVRDEKKLEAAVKKLPPKFRAVEVLVNNAGLALGLEPAHRAKWEDWRQMIDTNCAALAHLTRLLLPGMVDRNRGHIINIGSVAGSFAYPGGNVYGATKAFVEQFSRGLRADLLGSAVRVTNIEPGMVGQSDFSLVRFKGDAVKAGTVYSGIDPLDPESIAECVAWAIAQPAHVNINRIELMPVCQAPGPFAVHRNCAGGSGGSEKNG